MKNYLYSILALPFYLLGLLPFRLFYLLSDFLFLLGYYVIGYRKKVIRQNLRNAFPQKTKEEIITIEKKYYAFMLDLMLETLKQLVMSPAEIERRFTFLNMEVLNKYEQQNQSILFVLGHFGNWEWCGQSFHLKKKFQQDVLYHQLSSGFFNWITYKIRTRFGVGLIPMQVSLKEMIRRKGILTATAFLADQTPANKDSFHWMQFLKQDTPVYLGTEKIGKMLNLPIIFVHIKKIKRGYYEAFFTIITDNPKDTPDRWITEQHTHMLEKDIIATPEHWLWSHRRWKHDRTNR